jgi:hypothetical protein
MARLLLFIVGVSHPSLKKGRYLQIAQGNADGVLK